MTYSQKSAIKIAKLLELNPPDMSNYVVEIIEKVIVDAMKEQRLAEIRAINSIPKNENGMIHVEEVIDKINGCKI
jgi:alpha-N-acetylglucosamine transferase